MQTVPTATIAVAAVAALNVGPPLVTVGGGAFVSFYAIAMRMDHEAPRAVSKLTTTVGRCGAAGSLRSFYEPFDVEFRPAQ